jgi:hypothetical protein
MPPFFSAVRATGDRLRAGPVRGVVENSLVSKEMFIRRFHTNLRSKVVFGGILLQTTFRTTAQSLFETGDGEVNSSD